MSANTIYLDTSAWVKCFVQETGSEKVVAMSESANNRVTHSITYVEMRAAFARAQRMDAITNAEKVLLVAELDLAWQTMQIVQVSESLVKRAGGLADRFGLRGYDSVHLAAAEAVMLASMPQPFHFCSFDIKLNEAASALGMV